MINLRLPSYSFYFSHLHLYTLIRSSRRLMELGRGRILIPGFIRSPPTLAVYAVARSLPLGGVGRGFPFNEDDTLRHFSYLSGTFIKNIYFSVAHSSLLIPVPKKILKFVNYSESKPGPPRAEQRRKCNFF